MSLKDPRLLQAARKGKVEEGLGAQKWDDPKLVASHRIAALGCAFLAVLDVGLNDRQAAHPVPGPGWFSGARWGAHPSLCGWSSHSWVGTAKLVRRRFPSFSSSKRFWANLKN